IRDHADHYGRCTEAKAFFRSNAGARWRAAVRFRCRRRRCLCLGRRPSSREVAFGQTGPPPNRRGRTMSETIAEIKIPDSKMAKDLTELIRDKEPDLLYHHSRRVYLFGALTGQRKGLAYDTELLYVGAMFHDIGLTEQYRDSMLRFEVDGANAARDFLRKYGVPESPSKWCGMRSRSTPRRACPSSRKRWWHWSPPGSRWTSSGTPTRSLTNSRGLAWWPPIPAAISSGKTLSTPSITVWRIGRIAPLAPLTTTCWHSKIRNSNAPISAR